MHKSLALFMILLLAGFSLLTACGSSGGSDQTTDGDSDAVSEADGDDESEATSEEDADSEAASEVDGDVESEADSEAESESDSEADSELTACLAVSGSCYIDEVCYAAGEAKSDDACLHCDAASDDQAWTSAPDTTPCDTASDADSCTTSQHCDGAGVCVGVTCGGHGSCGDSEVCICDNTHMNALCTACTPRNSGYPACEWDGSFPLGYCATHLCSKVPPTGQTLCFSDASSIACPSTGGSSDCGSTDWCGQDAQYTHQTHTFTCYDADGASTDCASLPTAGADETVADDLTGLLWERTSASGKDWSLALDYCSDLSYADRTDWRLPTPFDWASILTHGLTTGKAIDPVVFPAFSTSAYWTGAPDFQDAAYAWIGTTMDGTIINTILISSDVFYATCVREDSLESGTDLFEALELSGETGSEVVNDHVTGLVWADSYSEGLTWKQALAYCEGLTYAGQTDWRLPNKNELMSLVNFGAANPASDFPGMPNGNFWSSTTVHFGVGSAYIVTFSSGLVSLEGKAQSYAGRCVRSGP